MTHYFRRECSCYIEPLLTARFALSRAATTQQAIDAAI